MVNGTLLNFGKRYNDNLNVIFDQWPKLHLGLDMRPEIPILKGLYPMDISHHIFIFFLSSENYFVKLRTHLFSKIQTFKIFY